MGNNCLCKEHFSLSVVVYDTDTEVFIPGASCAAGALGRVLGKTLGGFCHKPIPSLWPFPWTVLFPAAGGEGDGSRHSSWELWQAEEEKCVPQSWIPFFFPQRVTCFNILVQLSSVLTNSPEKLPLLTKALMLQIEECLAFDWLQGGVTWTCKWEQIQCNPVWIQTCWATVLKYTLFILMHRWPHFYVITLNRASFNTWSVWRTQHFSDLVIPFSFLLSHYGFAILPLPFYTDEDFSLHLHFLIAAV